MKIKQRTILIISASISLIGLFLPLLFYINIFNGSFSSTSTEWNDFGSYYGGVVGPILSFVSIILILYNIKLQNDSIIGTNKDFNTKLEYYSSQIDILNQQKFDNHFHQLLNYKKHIIDSYQKGNREGFDIFNMNMKELLENARIEKHNHRPIIISGNPNSESEQLFSKYLNVFNYIIDIAATINNNQFIEKLHYYNLLFNSLIDSEIKMLIICRDLKDVCESNYDLIQNVLSDFNSITLDDLLNNHELYIYQIASIKGIIRFKK